MMKRVALMFILALIVAAGVWMGTRAATEWSRLREIDAGIREQESAVQEAREEGRKLREEVEKARTEVGAAADSLGSNPTGLLMDRSFDIAKMEANVEQARIRAQRRLRHLEREREKAVAGLRRWGGALAGVEAFLIGGLVVVGRYRRRAD